MVIYFFCFYFWPDSNDFLMDGFHYQSRKTTAGLRMGGISRKNEKCYQGGKMTEKQEQRELVKNYAKQLYLKKTPGSGRNEKKP